eukprot:m.173543 g.173543  ORF g.173543 m.173543 type:complete len:54 (+) comp16531_c2_seq1:97-258(+)
MYLRHLLQLQVLMLLLLFVTWFTPLTLYRHQSICNPEQHNTKQQTFSTKTGAE